MNRSLSESEFAEVHHCSSWCSSNREAVSHYGIVNEFPQTEALSKTWCQVFAAFECDNWCQWAICEPYNEGFWPESRHSNVPGWKDSFRLDGKNGELFCIGRKPKESDDKTNREQCSVISLLSSTHYEMHQSTSWMICRHSSYESDEFEMCLQEIAKFGNSS